MTKQLRLCLLATALSMAAVWGQTITGTITGTVTDPSGAVVPNVRVTATNTETNVATSGATNDAGVYNLLFLPVGRYTVTTESTGFKQSSIGPFTLEVNQTARVDISLQVGQTTERVEVSAAPPILQTESTQTGDVLSSNKLVSLPLNGRNFASLTLLLPGAITPNPSSFSTSTRFGGGGRPYVNGNREQTNNFLLDGVDVNDSIDNRIGYTPNVDALQEVNVITGNGSAEFGNSSGAVVNMVFKGGTNEFHGSLFEFLRNEKLDANGFFGNRSGGTRRPFRRNIFGGTFGGPIVRNRAFFFVDYEGTRQRDSGVAFASVLPQEFRNGDLSAFLRQATPQVVRDPLTGQPFPGNIIPQSRIVNPVARALFSNPNLYPLPNNAGFGPFGITNNYRGTSSGFINNDQGDAKIDLRATDRDNVSGRYSIGRYRAGTGSVALPIQLGSGTEGPTTGGVVTWTRTISPTIVNEARVGYTRTVINDLTLDPTGVLGATGNQTLGIPGGQGIAGASGVTIGDGFTAVGGVGIVSNTVDNKFQYGDNLTLQVGRHLVKLGGQAIRYQQNRYYSGNNGVLGTFRYTNTYTGVVLGDFLLDQLNGKGQGSLAGGWGHRHWRTGLFVQDDFKATPNLTLNLGLRWEFTQPIYEVADRQVNINPVTGAVLFAGRDGNSRALYEPYYRQFMPRVGLAYTPGLFDRRMVVRAGYGITSFLEGTGANLRLPLNPPFFFESDVTFGLTNPGSIRTGFTDVQPLNTLSGQIRAWNPNLRPAFTQQANVSIEHQFTNSLSLTTAYVGQKGTHLVNPRELNQPLPGTGDPQQRRPFFRALPGVTNIAYTDSSANMNYHSLQVSGRQRLNNGVEFLTSYTLSKSLTDNLGYYGSGGVAAEGAYWQNAYDRRSNYGPAFFDARHNFSFGGTFQAPFGRDRRFGRDWNGFAEALLGGWTMNPVFSAHSGFPITLRATDRTNGQAVRGNVRPNRYRELQDGTRTIDNWFAVGTNTLCVGANLAGVDNGTCAYGDPGVGQFGSAGIGTERAPSYWNLDASVGKRFRVTEENYFDFRAEFFNLFNHTAFGPPAANIAASNFGQITSQVNQPRNIQFGLKYIF